MNGDNIENKDNTIKPEGNDSEKIDTNSRANTPSPTNIKKSKIRIDTNNSSTTTNTDNSNTTINMDSSSTTTNTDNSNTTINIDNSKTTTNTDNSSITTNINFSNTSNGTSTDTSSASEEGENSEGEDSGKTTSDLSLNDAVNRIDETLRSLNSIASELCRLPLDQCEREYIATRVTPLLDVLTNLASTSSDLASAVETLTSSPIVPRKKTKLKDTIRLIYDIFDESECIYKVLKKRINTLLCDYD